MPNGDDRQYRRNVYVTPGFVETCRALSNATNSVRIEENRIDNSSVNVSKHVAWLLSYTAVVIT